MFDGSCRVRTDTRDLSYRQCWDGVISRLSLAGLRFTRMIPMIPAASLYGVNTHPCIYDAN